jgi:hypothetical protein
MLPYSASKWALTGWSLSLHHDLAREGVHVTTVAPWIMRTGGPVNGTFKGSPRRLLYGLFAFADVMPLFSISPARVARAVVRGVAGRRAMVIVGLPSRLSAILFGLAPNLMSAVFATATRFLPRSFTHAGGSGKSLARDLGALGRGLAERSRDRNNQPVIDDAPAVSRDAPTADDVARAHAAATRSAR